MCVLSFTDVFRSGGRNPASAARSELRTLRDGLTLYRVDAGHYPRELSALWEDDYVRDELRDPWDRPYVYVRTSETTYDLWTYGRDGERGGEARDADIHAPTFRPAPR